VLPLLLLLLLLLLLSNHYKAYTQSLCHNPQPGCITQLTYVLLCHTICC
jgi:hypothetical protein